MMKGSSIKTKAPLFPVSEEPEEQETRDRDSNLLCDGLLDVVEASDLTRFQIQFLKNNLTYFFSASASFFFGSSK